MARVDGEVRNDVFILAQQAQQVYYTKFSSDSSYRRDWWTVVKTKAQHVIDIRGVVSENDECNIVIDLPFQEDQHPNIQPLSIAPELDHENLVRDNVFPEEVEVEGNNNVMNAHMFNTEEGGEEADDVIPDVDDDNNDFTSSSSENDSGENVR
ncbi:uncharacterized protein Fot_25591 [Forsythia ovata]|uniref:Uncharacterized protein n=1 Tax=Forsythia ovata TaxID=205694 RepID=A0ABD1U9G5_9LAMI